MELQSCMKAVISAINQYKTNQNDEATHSCLLRQLDVLIGITSKKPLASFNPGELLLNQCLAAVISTISDSHIKFLIAQKILTLFNNLVNSNVVCSILQNSFDLFGTLLDYFKLCSNPPHDLNMQLCIKVLQKITYKKQVVITLSKIEELLNYLLIHLEFQDDGTKYRLGLLSNLTFKTPLIQSFIKSKDNLKAILKKLMSYMSNSNSKIQIFAISILSNLCLHDEVGNKIFAGQNLSQMFHFLFNVLFISKSGTTQQHATDLFINIISNQRICDQLTEYSHLPQCLQLVVSNILTPSLQSHRAVLELLLSFSSVPKLRSHICNLLFNHPTCQDPSIGLDSILAQERSCFFFSLVATVVRDDHSISILCLDLILSLCSENSEFLKRNGRLDILVPTLTRVLFSSQSSDGCSKTLKLLRATQILKMLSSVTDIIGVHLDIEICLDLIHSHIDCLDGIFLSSSLHSVKINKNDMNLQSFLKHSEINQEDNNFGKPCHELVLQLVDFLTMYHPDDERVQDILEDSRFMPFIVNGLTSVTKECILISLKILRFLKIEHFSFNLLLDFMLKTNQQHHKIGSATSKRFPNNLLPFEICSVSSSESPAKAILHTISPNPDVNEMIANLIERVRCNAEIKDFKTSEIMSIYEFKLQDLQSKEKVLQDLLDAKSETLNQSEKVLSELKLRLAQHEAEAQNLRLLVLDSEKRKDELNDKVSKQTAKIESLQAEHDVIRRENGRLSEIEKSFKTLSLNYSGVSQKLESCQRSLESLKQDHQALSEMDEMLKKRHETLRDQHKALASKLASVEDEKSLLSIELKENSQRITDLTRALACCEDELKKKSTECEELESSMEKLQTELSRNVQSNRDLQHQVSSMELLCHQREVTIKEKDSLINQYKKELDNYVQAAALFHKLTSGTNKSDS